MLGLILSFVTVLIFLGWIFTPILEFLERNDPKKKAQWDEGKRRKNLLRQEAKDRAERYQREKNKNI